MFNQNIALNNDFSASQASTNTQYLSGNAIASEALQNAHLFSHPLIARHFELIFQAQEREELLKRLMTHLELSNQTLEAGLKIATPTPDKLDKSDKKEFKLFKGAFIRKAEKLACEQGFIKYAPARESYANTLDFIRRLLEKGYKKSGQDFITLTHKNLSKCRGISIRTSKTHIALAKEMKILDVRSVRNHQQGRRIVVKKGINFSALEYYKNTPQPQACQRSTEVEQSAKLGIVKCKIATPIYNSTRVRAFSDPSDNCLQSTSSSAPTIKTDEELPKKVEEDNKAMMSLWVLLNELILSEFKNRITVNEIYFLSRIKSLYQSHFGSVEAVEAYIRKVAGNDFLMGRKSFGKGEDRYWQFNLAQIFSAKMIEASWTDSGMFCDYAKQRQDKASEGEEMAKKAQPVKLATLTLEEVVAGAKNSTDAQVKTALFRKLGADTYKSWFHNYDFTFEGMEGKTPLFTVSGNYAKQVIGERYYHQMAEAGMCHA